MTNVVSFSGGKDSTAMLLMLIERGEPIHSVVWFDTGWEFPAMHEHVDLVEQRTGIKIVRLRPERSFEYWLYERPIRSRTNRYEFGRDERGRYARLLTVAKGEVFRIGYGWPSPSRRWCTREKVRGLKRHFKSCPPDAVQCCGFAADEAWRADGKQWRRPDSRGRFPLIEWGVTEADALAYCRERGYDWGGLYEHFDRVSCFCCPLQGIASCRTLRRHYPELWQRMLDMDSRMPGHNRGFNHYATVHDLDARFADEDAQAELFTEDDE